MTRFRTHIMARNGPGPLWSAESTTGCDAVQTAVQLDLSRGSSARHQRMNGR